MLSQLLVGKFITGSLGQNDDDVFLTKMKSNRKCASIKIMQAWGTCAQVSEKAVCCRMGVCVCARDIWAINPKGE